MIPLAPPPALPVEVVGKVSKGFQAAARAELRKLPACVAEQLSRNGVKVFLTDRITRVDAGEAWGYPRDPLCRARSSYDDTTGAYVFGKRYLVLSETSQGVLYPFAVGTFYHEVGHALDDVTRTTETPEAPYQTAFKADVESLKHRKLPKSLKDELCYYTADNREAFAELFSNFYGFGSDPEIPRVADFFPQAFESISRLVTDSCP